MIEQSNFVFENCDTLSSKFGKSTYFKFNVNLTLNFDVEYYYMEVILSSQDKELIIFIIIINFYEKSLKNVEYMAAY